MEHLLLPGAAFWPETKGPFMKKYSILLILALACGCLTNMALAADNKAEAAANGGRLIVGRTANFGGITVVLLSIDGKQVAAIPRGQKYDAPISSGRHEISATIAPNYGNSPPSKHTIDVEAGRAYAFTATWKADAMVLAPNR
jgi:hypothetical protein